MFGRIGNLSVFGMFLGLVVLLASCGGSPSGSRTYKDGRIFLENHTAWTLDTRFFNEELEELVEDVVEPDEKREISGGVLKGGTKVTLSIVPRRNVWGNPGSGDLEIIIDGNITIQAKLLQEQAETGWSSTVDIEYIIGR